MHVPEGVVPAGPGAGMDLQGERRDENQGQKPLNRKYHGLRFFYFLTRIFH